MSVHRRRIWIGHHERREHEQAVRCRVAQTCRAVGAAGVPVVHVTRCLALSERTVRRWRHDPPAADEPGPACLGRRPRCASREERNRVYQFLRERGADVPLAALRAAFPELTRGDLEEVLKRYRRVQRRKAGRYRSRLVWQRPGTVWGADFKEPREPIAGRYVAVLSVRDLGSRCQLLWEPVEQATGETVRDHYRRLFAQYGPPLVLKTDNGGPFRADETKHLLAEQGVMPLFNPRRRPAYNGGTERANRTLTGYQQALAEFRGRPGLPTREDAAGALRLANDLTRPEGLAGPTAAERWAQRLPTSTQERAAFQATVQRQRVAVRAAMGLTPEESLRHYAQAAVDRRAVRDALVSHGLLTILPRHPKRGARARQTSGNPKTDPRATPSGTRAGIIQQACTSSSPTVGDDPGPTPHPESGPPPCSPEAHSSTHKTHASGQT